MGSSSWCPCAASLKNAPSAVSDSKGFSSSLNEMHLGLWQLIGFHGTFLDNNILARYWVSRKAEPSRGGEERSRCIRNHSPSLQLSVTTPCCCRLLSSVFQAQIKPNKPNHRQMVGRRQNRKKMTDSSKTSAHWTHWWTEDFLGLTRSVRLKCLILFIFSALAESTASKKKLLLVCAVHITYLTKVTKELS